MVKRRNMITMAWALIALWSHRAVWGAETVEPLSPGAENHRGFWIDNLGESQQLQLLEDQWTLIRTLEGTKIGPHLNVLEQLAVRSPSSWVRHRTIDRLVNVCLNPEADSPSFSAAGWNLITLEKSCSARFGDAVKQTALIRSLGRIANQIVLTRGVLLEVTQYTSVRDKLLEALRLSARQFSVGQGYSFLPTQEAIRQLTELYKTLERTGATKTSRVLRAAYDEHAFDILKGMVEIGNQPLQAEVIQAAVWKTLDAIHQFDADFDQRQQPRRPAR